MVTSPALIAHAAFLGLHHVAQEHLKANVLSPDDAERLRVNLAAYSLGSAFLLRYIEQSHAWPFDDFVDKYSTAFVKSPGFPDTISTLEDVVVHAREKGFILEGLKKLAPEADSDELWNRLRDPSNLLTVLIRFRYGTYHGLTHDAAKIVGSDVRAQELTAAHVCAISWLWGTVPETPNVKSITERFVRKTVDWMDAHVVNPLSLEE